MKLAAPSIRYVPPANGEGLVKDDPARFVCLFRLPSDHPSQPAEMVIHIEATNLGADEPHSAIQERAKAALSRRIEAIRSALE